MIFTSYSYLLFLAAAFLLHWTVPVRARVGLLIALSYVFYCSWRWQYGFLLLAFSLFTWGYGMFLSRANAHRGVLAAGIIVELFPLTLYKYTPFLVGNANAVFGTLGSSLRWSAPNLALPLGISFFTFQGVAYLVDVANGEEPIRRVDHFLLYKAFWPQLIAGPIIRPHEIRDQIASERRLAYSDFSEGSRRVLVGLFKKAVLADTLAPYVDAVFQAGARPAAMDCAVATVAFAMQIYFDFSGYSDVAIGSARLLGFQFPENFDYPYAASSPQEFWNRWHMTLTRWIRDYVFTPLAFHYRRRASAALLSVVAAMALCGLWHGGRWTFVVWGIWHGVLLVANQTVLKTFWSRAAKPVGGRRLAGVGAWAATMVAVIIGWIPFRATSMSQTISMLTALLTLRGGLKPAVLRENALLLVAACCAGLLLVQLLRAPAQRLSERLAGYRNAHRVLRAAAYAALVLTTVVFEQDVKAFVYFQF
jgi:alginate O-acetyltransferase complex protein AlgI